MAQYKGIEAADDVVQLMRHMDGVDETREALQALQGVWDMLTLLGEFSGTGVEIGSLRSAFADLSGPLLNQLARQARQRAQQQLRTKAQVAIDILVRNLFERTADIGFLATDDDLCAFHAADAAERSRLQPRLQARLREYQAKYTVYDDIVLQMLLARCCCACRTAAPSRRATRSSPRRSAAVRPMSKPLRRATCIPVRDASWCTPAGLPGRRAHRRGLLRC